MNLQQPIGSYIIITPVKDEERFLETTIHAVAGQTVRPKKWVIVDDGSRDRTGEILEIYADKFDWIQVHKISRDAVRRLGSAEIRAFEVGFNLVKDETFDFVIKLDADLDLPANYFEALLRAFQNDERLGIASGTLLEKHNDQWKEIKLPEYHAVGASKMVRRECYFDIGGFPQFPGWDTADEIKAQVKGWRTCHIRTIPIYHLRAEGSAIGYRVSILHGEVYYVCGGGTAFFILKALNRVVSGRPFLVDPLLFLYGYLQAMVRRKPRLVNKSEAAFYQRLLNERIFNRIGGLFRQPKVQRDI